MSKSLPSGWSLTSISNICSSKYGVVDGPFGSNLKTEHYRDSGVPVFQSGFVTSNRFVKKNYVYVDQEKYQEQIRSSAAPKDILMAKIGMNAGACAVIPDDHSVGILAGNSLKMTVNKDVASNLFLVNHLHFMQQNGELRKLLTETAQPAISITTLKRHCVPLPPLPEQKKIAAILTSVDEVIEKTQAQIDKLKDLKTGMMQELLTRGVGVDGKPHTEFKDSPVGRIPKGWDVVPISALCSHIVDCVNKTAPVVDYKTPYKMIRTTNVRHGRVDTENVRSVTKETYELWVRRLAPQKGDLIFTREAPVGECGVLEDERGVFLGQRTMMYRADTIKTSSHFLMYSLMSEYGKKQLEDFSGGSTVPHMRVPDCGKILVKIPPKNEQDLIVRSLKSVDAAITNKEAKLQKVNDTKKALMQDLLTGKIRVKVED
ncbi:restriction endonuclease subunit S [Vibrio cyclitrophicus]|nr:restriction endonuclease subunit S [Vibrio cyclitrophicus]UPR33492.1 restriction endonuclease subunit S [Vibrio cyclitrophicus]